MLERTQQPDTSYPQTFDSALPKNLDAERSTLGSLLFPGGGGRATVQTLMLTKHDFFDVDHQQVFQAMVELAADFRPLDLQLVVDAMKRRGEWRPSGGTEPGSAALLAEISQSVLNAAHVDEYAALVREASRKRQLCELATNLYQGGQNGRTADELIARTLAELNKVGDTSQGTLEFMDSAAFTEADFTQTWLVDDVLVAGQPAIVGGPMKGMKTTSLIDLAISLASGTPFFGRWQVANKQRVVMMSGESGGATLRETASRICNSRDNVDLAGLGEWLTWSQSLPDLTNPTIVQELRSSIKRLKADVLILDPAYMCMADVDHASVFKMGATLAAAGKMCSNQDVTLIIAHHYRRGIEGRERYDPPELTDLAYAGFSEWARQWLLFERREKYELGSGRHKLWLSVGGSAGHNSTSGIDIEEGVFEMGKVREYNVRVISEAEAIDERQGVAAKRRAEKLEAKDDEATHRMADVLRQHRDGVSFEKWHKEAGFGRDRGSRALVNLRKQGRVCDVDRDKIGGGKATYYMPTKDT